MCTVTFIPSNGKVFLSSNRDEKQWRKDAVKPTVYHYDSGKILFPKDADAGGTWIAIHENGNAVVFLNGGRKKHTPHPPYRKSRGLILIDLIEGATPYNSFLAVKLAGIEPFTAIIWDDQHLFECRWDGVQKYSLQLDEKLPHIWSSVTLYDEAVIKKRRNWFDVWIEQNSKPTQKEILHFHQFGGDGDCQNDFRMNREGKVFTVSVTSIAIGQQNATIKYLNLKNDNHSEESITFEKIMASR